MVEIKDSIVFDREKEFVPDCIWFINFVVKNYNNTIAPEPRAYAE